MRFTSSEQDIKDSIEFLDKLINAKNSNVLQVLKKYKETNEIDSFTSYRLKKELAKMGRNI